MSSRVKQDIKWTFSPKYHQSVCCFNGRNACEINDSFLQCCYKTLTTQAAMSTDIQTDDTVHLLFFLKVYFFMPSTENNNKTTKSRHRITFHMLASHVLFLSYCKLLLIIRSYISEQTQPNIFSGCSIFNATRADFCQLWPLKKQTKPLFDGGIDSQLYLPRQREIQISAHQRCICGQQDLPLQIILCNFQTLIVIISLS